MYLDFIDKAKLCTGYIIITTIIINTCLFHVLLTTNNLKHAFLAPATNINMCHESNGSRLKCHSLFHLKTKYFSNFNISISLYTYCTVRPTLTYVNPISVSKSFQKLYRKFLQKSTQSVVFQGIVEVH